MWRMFTVDCTTASSRVKVSSERRVRKQENYGGCHDKFQVYTECCNLSESKVKVVPVEIAQYTLLIEQRNRSVMYSEIEL